MARRADLVAAFVRHGEFPVRRILDVGCGLGLMRGAAAAAFPEGELHGRRGRASTCAASTAGSRARPRPSPAPQPFDLVICYDVLQYLETREAAAALRNLGRLCRGVLHFGVLTTEDWELYCDRATPTATCTSGRAPGTGGGWRPPSSMPGSGMFVRRGAPIHLWELDQVEVLRPRRAG